MKYKIIYLIIILAIGNISYAGAIIERNIHNNYSHSSNIIRTNISSRNEYDSETINSTIKELQSKLKKEPNNYGLNVSLAELYIKTKNYEDSFSELVYISNLNQKNKLNEQTKIELNNLYNKLKQGNGYNQQKGSLYVNMSILALIMNEYEKAEKYISAAAVSNTDTKLLKKGIKKVFDETQDYNSAVEICNKILVSKPNNDEIRKLKAEYLQQLKDKDGAIAEYKIIVNNNKEDEESFYELYKLLQSKETDEKNIIKEMFPNEDINKGISKLVSVLLKNNNNQEAKKYCQILITKYPEDVNGYLYMAEIYRKEGKLKEAYEALSKARDMADNNDAIAKYNVLLAKLSDEPLQEANSLMNTGLYGQALSVLQSADQENLYVILGEARAYYFLNQKQKSLDYLNKAMTLYPNNSDVFCAFGYIYHKEQDLESAEKYTKEALKISPDNKTAIELLKVIKKSEADKYVNNIISTFESQNYKETMRLIDEAISISPDFGLLYYYKGLTYIAENNYAASTSALYKCIELDKNNITAYFYLALAFDNLSEKNTALSYYEEFIQKLPKDDYGESEKLQYAKERIEKIKSEK